MSLQEYPDQTPGVERTFKKVFTTPSEFNVSTPYVHIRLARMRRAGDCKVEISNVRFKKVE